LEKKRGVGERGRRTLTSAIVFDAGDLLAGTLSNFFLSGAGIGVGRRKRGDRGRRRVQGRGGGEIDCSTLKCRIDFL
jgi:hypothetical protein